MQNELIGFIGLGIMGMPMAKKLIDNGVSLMVNDLNPNAVRSAVDKGAKTAPVTEIGRACDIVFTILPNGAVVRQTLFGESGTDSIVKQGSIVVDMSSVRPDESRQIAEQLRAQGVGFLDCPVSGGEPKAIDGTLSFMCGGTQQEFEKILPYLNMMGSNAQLLGAPGSGSVTKLVNQMIVNLSIAAISEGMVLAAKAGVDPERVYQAIRGGLAGSVVLDAKVPMMLSRNFTPGGKISINHKDILNVLTTAHEIDVPVPMTSQLFEIFQALKVGGHMDEDHSVIVQYFEGLAGVQVQKREEQILDK